MMRFRFVVEAEVSRESGLFESRDTIGAALLEALEQADPGDIQGDNGGTYVVDGWSVEEDDTKTRRNT